jgi:hypothetical protein
LAKKSQESSNANNAKSVNTAQEIIDDIKQVAEDFDSVSVTRDFYRNHGKYPEGIVRKYFATHQELLIAAGLKKTREGRKVEGERRVKEEAAWLQEYADKEILPYHNKYWKDRKPNKKVKTVIVASDFHCTEADPFSVRVFLDTCRLMQPDDIVLNGDILDFYGFSSFSKDSRRIDWAASKRWLDKLLSTLREICPKSNIIWIIGNHCLRLFRWHADSLQELRRTSLVEAKLQDVI